MRYAYGMKNRGFSIGCQPMKDWVGRIDDPTCRYYDILIYRRKLTDREVSDYELEYIENFEERWRRIY